MRLENSAWAGDACLSPREIVRPNRFAQLGKTVDARKLTDEQMRIALEQYCLVGLLWGFANPDAFRAWYVGYVEDADGRRARARASGVEVDEPSDLSSLFDDSETILRNYEQDIGSLPEIPDRLQAEARALGREL